MNNDMALKNEYEKICKKMNDRRKDKMNLFFDQLSQNDELFKEIYDRSENEIIQFATDIVDVWIRYIKAAQKRESRAQKVSTKDISVNNAAD